MRPSPDKNKMLHATTRQEWRTWLEKHYRSETEVWLVYARKHSGKPRIAYNDAVEEALCFGWIDSTVKSIDQDSFAQRFSVRKPQSPYLGNVTFRMCLDAAWTSYGFSGRGCD